MLNVRIEGSGHGTGQSETQEVHVHKKDEHIGFHVFTTPFFDFDPVALPFVDLNGSTEMAVDAQFSGTPEGVHDGGDRALWTPTTITGTWDFASTTHSYQAVCTIVDYTQLSGATLQIIGTGIADTTRTEGGGQWTAATSNAATATSLASSMDSISGCSASASGAVVTVTADNGNDITTFLESDATNMPASAQSVDGSATVNADMALFEDGTSIDLSNFTAVTGRIFLTRFTRDKNDVTIQFRSNGVVVGTKLNINDFIDDALLNSWQKFILTKANLGVSGETVDEIVIGTEVSSGNTPLYWLDVLQVEVAGGTTFTMTPPNERFLLTQFDFTIADVVASTVANGTMPGLSYDQILGVAKLALGGITLTRFRKDAVAFAANFTQFSDFLLGGFSLLSAISDGTNTHVHLRNDIVGSVLLEVRKGDKITLSFAEDLSGLLTFKAVARGLRQIRELEDF